MKSSSARGYLRLTGWLVPLLCALLSPHVEASPVPAAPPPITPEGFAVIVRSVRQATADTRLLVRESRRVQAPVLQEQERELARLEALLQLPQRVEVWLPEKPDRQWFLRRHVIHSALRKRFETLNPELQAATDAVAGLIDRLADEYNRLAPDHAAQLREWMLPPRLARISGDAGAPAAPAAAPAPVPGGPGAPAPPAPREDLGEKVLRFAQSQVGRQVGNGECWTLAAEALRAAGAQRAHGYSFGKEVSLEALRPGDILQFTSARFETPRSYYDVGTPNHTAIVQAVQGSRIQMLHQNFAGDRRVSTLVLDLRTRTGGRIQAYRPIPPAER